MQRALILGATGGMGRRVTDLWRSECPGVALRLGARRPEGLSGASRGQEGAKLRRNEEVTSVHREVPESLRAALAGTAVVINAIGPYDYDPVPLLDACETAGTHYVDLASEPEYLAAAGTWGRQPGRTIAICPGASAVPGLVELTAARLGTGVMGVPSSVEIYLSMGSAHSLTTGLLASLTLPLGGPLRSADGARAFRALRLHPVPPLGRRWFGRYPAPFDEKGVQLGGRTVSARLWVGFDRPWLVHALRIASYLRPRVSGASWKRLVRAVRPLAGLSSRLGTQPGGLRIEALDEAGRLLAAVRFHAGHDGMNVPALPPVWAARSLLDGAKPGWHSLKELIEFDAAAESLRRRGIEIHEEVA